MGPLSLQGPHLMGLFHNKCGPLMPQIRVEKIIVIWEEGGPLVLGLRGEPGGHRPPVLPLLVTLEVTMTLLFHDIVHSLH